MEMRIKRTLSNNILLNNRDNIVFYPIADVLYICIECKKGVIPVKINTQNDLQDVGGRPSS